MPRHDSSVLMLVNVVRAIIIRLFIFLYKLTLHFTYEHKVWDNKEYMGKKGETWIWRSMEILVFFCSWDYIGQTIIAFSAAGKKQCLYNATIKLIIFEIQWVNNVSSSQAANSLP